VTTLERASFWPPGTGIETPCHMTTALKSLSIQKQRAEAPHRTKALNPRPGDVEEELERLHEESFGWALGCCDFDHAEAEDVLQMTYVRVISGKASYGGKAQFRTWLFGVIRLVALEHRRNRQRRERLDTSVVSHLSLITGEDAGTSVERSQSAEVLVAALGQLPGRQKEVLHLVFYEGLSVAEAAEVMGVSVGSARTHYARGKDRMRALLEGVER